MILCRNVGKLRKYVVLNYEFREFYPQDILLSRRIFVTLQDFSAFLCIKAVWGIEGKWGYDLATVLNSTFFHLKVEVWLRILL